MGRRRLTINKWLHSILLFEQGRYRDISSIDSLVLVTERTTWVREGGDDLV